MTHLIFMQIAYQGLQALRWMISNVEIYFAKRATTLF